jgi:hypothetical protein
MNFYRKVFLFCFAFAAALPLRAGAEPTQWRQIKEIDQTEKAAPVATGAGIERPRMEYGAKALRDPFKGYEKRQRFTAAEPSSAKRPLPSLQLQGLIWGGEFPQAVVNNKVVNVGDSVEGAKVIKINRDGIEVLFDGAPYAIASPLKNALRTMANKNPEGKNDDKAIP